MKTLSIRSTFAISAVVLFFTAFGVSSCKKDKTCHGEIHVIDTTGIAVGTANVKFNYQAGGDVVYTGVTDGSGDVTIDVKLPAILDVTATKGTKIGTGVIRLDEPGKTAALTVTIQ